MKYFIRLNDGTKYEIDELDYNTINGRINTGRYNGFYQMRGEINQGMQFNFKYFMTVEAKGDPKPKDKNVRNIDIAKHKPPEVGKPVKPIVGCQHDWNAPDTWEYIVKNIHGKLQYRKRCVLGCGKVSPLIKPKEVKVVMETNGKTLDDVKQVAV